MSFVAASETGSPPAAGVAFFLSGFHAGSRVELEPERVLTFGSSDEDEIILSDNEVSVSHLSMTLKEDRGGRQTLHIQAIGGGVGLDDGHQLDRGGSAVVDLPGRIELLRGPDLEPITIMVDAATVARDARGTRVRHRSLMSIGVASPRAMVGGLSSVAVICVAGLLIWLNAGPAPSSPAVGAVAGGHLLNASDDVLASSTAGDGETSAAASGGSVVLEAPDGAQRAADAFRERLDAAGLGQLGVSVSAGVVVVSGSLTATQREAWLAQRRWFDDTQSATLTVDVRRDVENQPMPRRPTAVFAGDAAFIIDSSGELRRPGAVTSDGWTVRTIEKLRVALEKGGRTIVVEY